MKRTYVYIACRNASLHRVCPYTIGRVDDTYLDGNAVRE